MKPILIILAHQAAQPTINDFLPRWKALDCELVCHLPDEDRVDGFDRVENIGRSAYSGYLVFDRFTKALAYGITKSDLVVIAEYDTVPLHPVFPKMASGKFTSFFTYGKAVHGDNIQLCALSPWCFDRESGHKMLRACLTVDPFDDYPAGGGLLDRYIGRVVASHQIPCKHGSDILSYPWHEGSVDRIRNMGYNWIHGWKSKEDFGPLWMETLTSNE